MMTSFQNFVRSNFDKETLSNQIPADRRIVLTPRKVKKNTEMEKGTALNLSSIS